MIRALLLLVLLLLAALPASYLGFGRENTTVEQAREATPTASFVDTASGRTHLELRQGTGSRVVLLHGGTVPMWTWDDYMAPLEQAGFQLLRYDLFGRGLSDRVDGKYDRELHLRQLEELLAAVEWIGQPVDLIGVSLGGALATSFAATHPERVRTLVLISPVVDLRGAIPAALRWPVIGEYLVRVMGVPQARGRIEAMTRELPGGGAMLERFTQQTRVFGFEALVLSMVRGDLLGDYAGSYQQVGRHAIPTLVVWGEDDPEITADQIETIRAAIPDHEFLPVSNAGHAVAVTHHGVIIDRIIPWLKRSP